jgi:hypothetical protein
LYIAQKAGKKSFPAKKFGESTVKIRENKRNTAVQ